MKLNKELLLNILEEGSKENLKYCIEVLFPFNKRKLLLKEKLNLFKEFLNKLKVEENFEYVWIKLDNRTKIKFWIILDKDLDQEKLENIWFSILNNNYKKENLILKGDYIFDLNLFYIENLNYFGFSENLKKFFNLKLKEKENLYNKNFIKKELKDLDIKLKDIINELNLFVEKDLKEGKDINFYMIEKYLEQYNIKEFNVFIEKHHYWSNLLEILVYSLKDELKKGFNLIEQFLMRIKNFENNILYQYLQKIKKEKSFYILLKNILLFFLFNNLKGEKKYTNQEIRIYLGELLINVLSSEERNNYLEDQKFRLGTEIMFYLEALFEHIFLFEKIKEIGEGLQIKIGLQKTIVEYLKLPKFFKYDKKLPMIVEPVDWSENILGGYLLNNEYIKKPLVKKNRSSDLKFLNNREYDIINKLQKIKVKFNKDIINYISNNYWNIRQWIFKTNDSIDNLKIKLEGLTKIYNFKKENNILEKVKRIRQLIVDLENFEENFKWMIFFNNFEYFYYSYFLCFRGRINVEANILNYQNNKFIRGTLDSYEKSNLDINWFKIAFIRYKGSDLRIKEELIKEFDKIENLVYNYENNPEIWYESEEPWQVLRYCIEYKKYIDFYKKSDNADKKYKTNLLISFDCTCSALQLISCLLKNNEYAEELNLINKGKKGLGDIYIKLSKEFKEYLEENTKKEELKYLKVLDNKLRDWKSWRKLLKKIFMTLNYGLSDYGIREKIYEANYKYKLGLITELVNYLYKYLVVFIKQHKLLKVLNLITKVYKDNKDNFKRELNLYLNKYGILFINDKKNADFEQKIYYNKLEKIENAVIDRVYMDFLGKEQRKKSDVKFLKKTNEIDLRKSINSLRANLIHTYDALWLLNTLENLLNENLFVLVIFDCVFVNYENIEKVYKAFEDGLKILFKNEDQLYNLFYYLLKKDNVDYLSEEDETYIKNLVSNLKGDFDISKQNLDYFIFP